MADGAPSTSDGRRRRRLGLAALVLGAGACAALAWPRFTDCPLGDDAKEHVTREHQRHLAAAVDGESHRRGVAPARLEAVEPLAELSANGLVDGWGNDFVYERLSDTRWRLTSWGADGVPGGEGPDADIVRESGTR